MEISGLRRKNNPSHFLPDLPKKLVGIWCNNITTFITVYNLPSFTLDLFGIPSRLANLYATILTSILVCAKPDFWSFLIWLTSSGSSQVLLFRLILAAFKCSFRCFKCFRSFVEAHFATFVSILRLNDPISSFRNLRMYLSGIVLKQKRHWSNYPTLCWNGKKRWTTR